MKPYIITALIFAAPVFTHAGDCDCLFEGGQPLPPGATSEYPNLPTISTYGTTCAAWDSSPGTPWFSSCEGDIDTCGGKNWCAGKWCYVSPNCSTAHPSGVFASITFHYSYEACETLNCYDEPKNEHCPYDPNNLCPSGCECLYPDGLPPNKYEGTEHESKSNVANYGSSCNAWDKVPGTPWHSSCASGADFCGSANWCEIPWCYVSSSCKSAHASNVFGESKDMHYSYEGCGSPDCYNSPESEGCPYDPDHSCPDTDCSCIYQGHTLPQSFISGSDYATGYPMVGAYGTSCAAWDQLSGTPYHEYCDTKAELCSGSWCQASWCYVNATTCPSAIPTDVFGTGTGMHYSYAACDSPNCYQSEQNPILPDKCPYDVAGACASVTCKEVKKFYRENFCCSDSAKTVDSPTWR